MSNGQPGSRIPDSLRFVPEWVWDPAPHWMIEHLDKVTLSRLAVIQLEHRQVTLENDLKANKLVLGAIREAMK